jgi:hypothetical protein
MRPITGPGLKKLEASMHSRLRNLKAHNSDTNSRKIRTRERTIDSMKLKFKNRENSQSDIMVLPRPSTTKNIRVINKRENKKKLVSYELREKKLKQQKTAISILEHDKTVTRVSSNVVSFDYFIILENWI